jgi:hypothetical protein
MGRLAAAVLTLAVLAATGSDAGAKQTYCQKTVALAHGTVLWKKNGVTIYRTSVHTIGGTGRNYFACSEAKHTWRQVFHDGTATAKPRLIRVAAKRCVAIEFTAPNGPPQIYMKDIFEKNAIFYSVTTGDGDPSAAVGSLAVSSNCAAAWGESVTDGSGNASHRIRAVGFSNATSLRRDRITEVAAVPNVSDTRHVGIAAAGKRVTVKWTEVGAPKQATLP